MALLLESLFEYTKEQYHLTLLAGAGGMRRMVNWIYAAEDMENARLLKRGQLIISTGFVASQDKHWMKHFIRTLIEKNTSGLLLNIGKYVLETDITPEIVTMCNEADFPLLVMPWEFSMCELSQDYCNRIFEELQRTYELSHAISTILLCEQIPPHVLDTLASHTYHADDTYCLGLLELKDEFDSAGNNIFPRQRQTIERENLLPSFHEGDSGQGCLQSLRLAAASCPSADQLDHVMFEYHKHLVIVWHNVSDTQIDLHTEELLACCESIPTIHGKTFGISLQTAGISHLPKLYEQAAAGLTMAKSVKQELYHFRDLGCYQILFASSDREVLRQYYRKYIGVLEDYDQEHDTSYVETLENYLRFDQHLTRIAEAMICHRNTVNYRISKIRELLGLDLNDGESKFHLQLAIHIRNFLRIFQ